MSDNLDWFDIEKYNKEGLKKLNAKEWLKLLDIREYYYSIIQLSKNKPKLNISLSNWTEFTDFLNNPLDIKSIDSHREKYFITTDYETYYSETFVEKELGYKIQNKAISKLSNNDINTIIKINKPIIKSIVDKGILQTLDPINGHNGISEKNIEELGLKFPSEEYGIKYLKIDTRYDKKLLIQEFIEYIEQEKN